MFCKLSKGLFPRLCGQVLVAAAEPEGRKLDSQGMGWSQTPGALQLLLLSGTPGHQRLGEDFAAKGYFLSPSHRCCVHNVQRLYQESNTGCGGEVGFYSQGQSDPLIAIPGMFLIKEFCRKLTVSSSPGIGDEGIGSGWWGSLEQRVGDQSCGSELQGNRNSQWGRQRGAADLRSRKPNNSQASSGPPGKAC